MIFFQFKGHSHNSLDIIIMILHFNSKVTVFKMFFQILCIPSDINIDFTKLILVGKHILVTCFVVNKEIPCSSNMQTSPQT